MKVGILGGGQLARMLALAGYPLGLRFRYLDLSAHAPAGHVGELLTGEFEDESLLSDFAEGLDVVTYEFENIPVASARRIARSVPLLPPPEALEAGQDRLAEKTLFFELGIDTAPFAPVVTLAELHAALDQLGLPAVLKTRRLGYDGKGQAVIRTRSEIDGAWGQLGASEAGLIVEAFVGFERELSIIAARGRDGATAFYPLVENHHEAGILRRSHAPAPDLTPELQELAQHLAGRVLDRLDYVGVLAIELFQTGGALLANEMAPRVHNSGHWTIEGAETSQFENHLRAICGLPLGTTRTVGVSTMLNLIGGVPPATRMLRVAGAHLHLYGKKPRPGRKLGHVTLRAEDPATLAAALAELEPVVRKAAR